MSPSVKEKEITFVVTKCKQFLMRHILLWSKPLFVLTIAGSASVTVVVLQIITDTTYSAVAGGSRWTCYAQTVTGSTASASIPIRVIQVLTVRTGSAHCGRTSGTRGTGSITRLKKIHTLKEGANVIFANELCVFRNHQNNDELLIFAGLSVTC